MHKTADVGASLRYAMLSLEKTAAEQAANGCGRQTGGNGGRDVIRGISRFAVEVCRTGSPYFERAICFVRPEFASSDRLDLHRAAQQFVRALDGGVEYSFRADCGGEEEQSVGAENTECAAKNARGRGLSRSAAVLTAAVSALLGAAAAAALCLYFLK